MRVIGLVGQKFHGKSTAAEALLEPPFSYLRIDFMDTMKGVCMLMYGLTDGELSDPRLKQKPASHWPHKSPRIVMNEVAFAMRSIDKDVWVKAWERRLIPFSNVVVSDVRMLNEAAAIRRQDGKLIRIVNPRIPKDELSGHISETELDQIEVDTVIYNDTSIRMLRAQVKVLVEDFYATE